MLYNRNQLKGISSLFSRRIFTGLLHNDINLIDQMISIYGFSKCKGETLGTLFKRSYSRLASNYRCEYVYKNELLNQELLKGYGTERTVAINEFKVGNSIADIAMFNGESKAFEIKSDLDTPFRLPKQMSDYTRLFQKCYVVVPEESFKNYINEIGSDIGVIVMSQVKRHLELTEYRKAESNNYIDSDLVISCLHTKEYMDLVNSYYGYVPDVSIFEMYDVCKNMMRSVPSAILQKLFLKEIESRKTSTFRLNKVQKELRQMCLCMNMSDKDIHTLNVNLDTTLN